MDFTIKNYRCFSDEDPARFSLRPGVGAFVGVNNSGKSTILRFFYEFRGLFEALSDLANLRDIARGQQVTFTPPQSVPDRTGLFSNFNDRPITISITNIDVGENPEPYMSNGIEVTIPRSTNQLTGSLLLRGGSVRPNADYRHNGPSEIIHRGAIEADVSELMAVAKRLTSTLYVAAFRNILNEGANQAYYDIQVGQAFVQQWRQRKTGENKAESLAVLQVTSDIEGIFGLDDLEINAADSGMTLQVIMDGKPYMLPELGSGLAQFILVLANAAVSNPAFILIDEPELNLHPSLQLDFLTTLGTYARSGLLYATHSLGLAQSAADRVYSVRKNDAGYSSIRPLDATPNLAQFSGELSFSAYKDLGFEQILLVEGPTDVRTILQFLRPLRKAHEIVLLPLNGRSQINGKAGPVLQEVKRITKRIAVVIDSERESEEAKLQPRIQNFVDLCRRMRIKCKVLDRRATENYLADEAVKAVKGDKYRALEPYEKLADVAPAWSKEENWKIAAKMTREDVASTDLGKFLASL